MKTAIFAAMVFLGLPAVVQAQQRPCAADVQKFCPGKQPGTREAFACLREHIDEVSAACKARLGGPGGRAQRGRMGPVRAMLQECKAELDQYCKGVQAGGGRFRACLSEHEKDLSARCKEALAQAKDAGKPGQKMAQKTEASPAAAAGTPAPTANAMKADDAGTTPSK